MKKKVCIILIGCLSVAILLSSLFFSREIEMLLKFKPNILNIENNALEIHFIDVGQGDAIAIKFPNNKTMLVDSGPITAHSKLMEYLDNIFFEDNYNTFDYVFLTHSDIDHSGNMAYILNKYNIKSFYRPRILSNNLESQLNGFKDNNVTYDKILETLKLKDITTYFATDNVNINTGAGIIQMYCSTDTAINKTNEFSPMLIINSNNCKVFLGGDSGEDIEQEIMQRNVLQDVDLMKLSHHGSKYSNSDQLLETITPEYVVCSVGENTYGHPASDVLLRLANYDLKYNKTTYDTFKTTLKDGNIIYYANSDSAMECISIGSLGSYLFLDWYVVVVIGCLSIVSVEVIILCSKTNVKKYRKDSK